MLLRRKEYMEWLTIAIRELKIRGRAHECLEDILARLKAQEPNRKTRIDLHEVFTKQSEEPIYPVYATRFEIWCIQTFGRVPEYKSNLYRERYQSFTIEVRFVFRYSS